ncbi:hypothetical protein K8T06_13505 [bacterium]|nr:hypothetical protein [bacterium]
MNSGEFPLQLFVDIDDTLFRTNERRVEWIAKELGDDHARLYLSGGDEDTQKDVGVREALIRLKKYCRNLDRDPEFYRRLPLVRNALHCLREIESKSSVKLCAYLSARPSQFATLSGTELNRSGFPKAPVFCRPEHIIRRHAASWKLSHITQLSSSKFDRLIIDDDLSVCMKIRRCTLQRIEAICFTEIVSESNYYSSLRFLDWRNILMHIVDHYVQDRRMQKMHRPSPCEGAYNEG